MKYKLTLAVMTLLLLTIGVMPAALADTLNFTLTQSAVDALPGDTVTFEATVFGSDYQWGRHLPQW